CMAITIVRLIIHPQQRSSLFPYTTLFRSKRSTLTVTEIAEYIGLSSDMIYILCREKRIPHIRIGRRILFKRAAIDEWLENQMSEDRKSTRLNYSHVSISYAVFCSKNKNKK